MRAGIPRTLGTEMEEAPGPRARSSPGRELLVLPGYHPGPRRAVPVLASAAYTAATRAWPSATGRNRWDPGVYRRHAGLTPAPGPGQSVMTASRRIQAESCAALCIKAPTSARLMRGIPRIFMLSATR